MADYDGTKNGQVVLKNDEGQYASEVVFPSVNEDGSANMIYDAIVATMDMAGIKNL